MRYPMLTPDHFRSAILRSLSNLTNSQSEQYVTTRQVIMAVADLLGINYDPKSNEGKDFGLRVNNAFRSMTPQAKNNRIPLCSYGNTSGNRGCWALTEEGLKAAQALEKNTPEKVALVSRNLPKLEQLLELCRILFPDMEITNKSKSELLNLLQTKLKLRGQDSSLLYDGDLLQKYIHQVGPRINLNPPEEALFNKTSENPFYSSPSVLTVEQLDLEIKTRESEIHTLQPTEPVLVSRKDLQALVWDSYLRGKRDAENQMSSRANAALDSFQTLAHASTEALELIHRLSSYTNSLLTGKTLPHECPVLEKGPIVNSEQVPVPAEPDEKEIKSRSGKRNLSKMNMTEAFIYKNKDKLYPYLEAVLTSKLRRSAEQDEIMDHVQSFLTKAVERDAWAKEITENGTILFSKIALFCIRSSYSDMRGWGKDPCCKALKGALTETERKKLQENPEPESYAFAHLRSDSGEVQWGGEEASDLHLQDVTAGDLREEIYEGFSQEKVLARCEQIIKSSVHNECDAYLHAMWGLASNMTAKEISESLGMDFKRGTALVSDLKRLLRKAKDMGRFRDL